MPEQVVAQRLGVEVVAAVDRVDEPREARRASGDAAALDEPVGVDEQRVARPQRDHVVGALGDVVEAEQQVGRRSRAAGPGRRPRSAPGAGARRSTSAADRARARRPSRSWTCASTAVAMTPDARGRSIARSSPRSTPAGGSPQRVGDATQEVAQLAHRGGGLLVVAGDVADDHRERAVRQQERVVPVAADLGLLGGGLVAHRHLQVAGAGRLR